jgi:hypothetical protein
MGDNANDKREGEIEGTGRERGEELSSPIL